MQHKLRFFHALLCGLLLAACGIQPIAQLPASTATSEPALPTPLPTAAPSAAAPVPAKAMPTLVATEPPSTPLAAAPTQPPAPPVRPTTARTVVLQVAAGSATGQVGVTPHAGPSTFRVAADGSFRILDTVNKRLLFFQPGSQGGNGTLQRTFDLPKLQRPSDFAVSTFGEVYVLDIDGWALASFAIDGTERGITSLHPANRGLFSSISLIADGSLWGVGAHKHYTMIFDSPDIPADTTNNVSHEGVVTVRSTARFAIASDHQSGQAVLHASNTNDGTPRQYPLGTLPGQASFLDVNQGMEPYVLVQQGDVFEVRRYSLNGQLLGSLTLDQQGCRSTSRSIYVDRPGNVFTICVAESGVTITRHTLTAADGQALPLFDELVTTAPWSPASLQATPG